MFPATATCLFLLACGVWGSFLSGSAPQVFDIVIYGGTPAGIAAAVAAAVAGPSSMKVAIVTPDDYIGGMTTAGGIGLRDIGDLDTVLNGSFAYNWAMLNAQHYAVNYPVWQPDNYVGNQSYWTILGQYSDKIEVHLNQPLIFEDVSVIMEGTTIKSIATGTSLASAAWWNATVFMDVSYDADLVLQSGCDYTFGRESRDTYNESYAGVQPYTTFGQFIVDVDPTFSNGSLFNYVAPGPLAPEGSADQHMMAYSYRLCITTNTSNQAPFAEPLGYNAADFSLLQAYITAKTAASGSPPLFDYLVGAYAYRSYPRDKTDLCDSNDAAVTSDAVGLNVGYVTTNRTLRALIAQRVKYYVQGYVYYLANDPQVPAATQASIRAYGLCKDEWPENGHWPLQMYIREGVRLIGDLVVTQNDIVGGKCRNDSIGLGSWTDDIHVVQRVAVAGPTGQLEALNEGEMMAPYYGSGNFPLPYALLLPKASQATNFLVPVANSISHAAIGGVREEPEYIALGTAAGIAAVLAIQSDVSVQDVDLASLQAGILAQNGLVQPTPCS
eukprot:m.186536 g.186536  ORF g.186536 m.186536 type:complete len:554 (-) comp53563_c0_seq1:120-1781(-)